MSHRFSGCLGESESHSIVSNSLRPHGSPWNSPGQNTGVGDFSLLQEIFPAQGLDQGLPHCRQILYCLSHQGVGSLSLLQQIVPTQESNQGLLHCRWILYQLSYQGSPAKGSTKSLIFFKAVREGGRGRERD